MFAQVVLAEQDCFADEAGWETLLSLLPPGGGSPA